MIVLLWIQNLVFLLLCSIRYTLYHMPYTLFLSLPAEGVEFFLSSYEFDRAVVEQNAAALGLVAVEGKKQYKT